jgi:hypothetical protein
MVVNPPQLFEQAATGDKPDDHQDRGAAACAVPRIMVRYPIVPFTLSQWLIHRKFDPSGVVDGRLLQLALRQLSPRFDVKLPEGFVQVVFDRAGADKKESGNLSVRVALCGATRDLQLLWSELVERSESSWPESVHLPPLARSGFARRMVAASQPDRPPPRRLAKGVRTSSSRFTDD